MPSPRTTILASTLAVVPIVAFGPTTVAASSAPTIVGAPSSYAPIGPLRLADTRAPACGCAPVDAGTIRVQIAGRDGIAAGITAAAVTVTATRTAGTGFVTVYPAGHGAAGDVDPQPRRRERHRQLWHRAGRRGRRARRLRERPDRPHRRRDRHVRRGADRDRPAASCRSPRRGCSTHALRAERRSHRAAGSPSRCHPASPADASAVAVNVTSVGAPVAGFFSAFPAALDGSNASFMNPDGSGNPRAAQVIVPVSPGGFTIATTSGGHVIADLVGWFTGPSAPASNVGLFVPTAPTRSLDTRRDQPRVWRGGTRELGLQIPATAAIVTNVTLTRTDEAGFVTAYPAGTDLPTTSSVNATTRDDSVPNLAITRTSRARHGVLLRPRHRPDRRRHRLLHRHAGRLAAARPLERPATVAGADRRRLDPRRRAVHPRRSGRDARVRPGPRRRTVPPARLPVVPQQHHLPGPEHGLRGDHVDPGMGRRGRRS